MSDGVIHIAGLDVQVGDQLRQRCAWCGAVLVDYDLSRMGFQIPEGKTEEQARADGDFRPATWAVGGLVMRDGPVSASVDHDNGDVLPDGCCAKLDPAVTA